MQPELLADLQRALRLNGEDGLGAAFCSGWTHNLKRAIAEVLIEELSKQEGSAASYPVIARFVAKRAGSEPAKIAQGVETFTVSNPDAANELAKYAIDRFGDKAAAYVPELEPVEPDPAGLVYVRRQWNDVQNIAGVLEAHLDGFHHDAISGGVNAISPRSFLHAYMLCTDVVKGQLSHSCKHGPPPHRIKVCIVQRDNTKDAYKSLAAKARK